MSIESFLLISPSRPSGGLPRFLFPLFSEAASIIHPLPLDESGLTERLGEAPGVARERKGRPLHSWISRTQGGDKKHREWHTPAFSGAPLTPFPSRLPSSAKVRHRPPCSLPSLAPTSIMCVADDRSAPECSVVVSQRSSCSSHSRRLFATPPLH